MNEDLKGGYVNHTIENEISYVEFFHPQSNSLPGSVLRLLAKTIDEASSTANSKVIVLKSGGDKAFCAGASFDELIAIEDIKQGKVFFSGFALVLNAIRQSSKFVVCRVQGKAAGGGLGILSACDYVIAKDDASVKLSELALGIGPFVVGPAVERKGGKAAFTTLSIDCDKWFSSQWALERGYYSQLAINTADLEGKVKVMADKLAKYSPDAMKELRGVHWQGTESWNELLLQRAEISGRLVLSEFTKNFITQFKNK